MLSGVRSTASSNRTGIVLSWIVLNWTSLLCSSRLVGAGVLLQSTAGDGIVLGWWESFWNGQRRTQATQIWLSTIVHLVALYKIRGDFVFAQYECQIQVGKIARNFPKMLGPPCVFPIRAVSIWIQLMEKLFTYIIAKCLILLCAIEWHTQMEMKWVKIKIRFFA